MFSRSRFLCACIELSPFGKISWSVFVSAFYSTLNSTRIQRQTFQENSNISSFNPNVQSSIKWWEKAGFKRFQSSRKRMFTVLNCYNFREKSILAFLWKKQTQDCQCRDQVDCSTISLQSYNSSNHRFEQFFIVQNCPAKIPENLSHSSVFFYNHSNYESAKSERK